ncbi:DMT family transporter, partial [Leucobacter sp. M11]|uniref:DMT family transporter n=1 Tax=Leucobacter sp. M11 TaxID=2993565 RepID=UPI003FA56AD6
MHWFLLATAIALEVFATSMLKASAGFTRLWPSIAVIGGYGLSFYLLSQVLRVLPVGTAYAIWSGAGT